MVLQAAQPRSEPVITWEPLPEDFVLPDDPVENIQQPPLAADLTDALGAANRIQPEMLIGSNCRGAEPSDQDRPRIDGINSVVLQKLCC